MAPLNNDTKKRLENRFIVYSYLRNYAVKLKIKLFQKKLFNARLTNFNVSLIFVLLYFTTRKRHAIGIL
jgi:hypothetical protein